MTEHERLLEEFEDARFALLMEGVVRKEGERLEALNEMLRENPEAAVPESLDRRCLGTIDRHFARERRRAGLRKTGKVLRLAAVVMAISVLLFTSAFALSENFRVATLNLMLTVTERYTQFDIKGSDGNDRGASSSHNAASTQYFQNAEIGWIPEGFECTESVPDALGGKVLAAAGEVAGGSPEAGCDQVGVLAPVHVRVFPLVDGVIAGRLAEQVILRGVEVIFQGAGLGDA